MKAQQFCWAFFFCQYPHSYQSPKKKRIAVQLNEQWTVVCGQFILPFLVKGLELKR
jgi:hypothetical protein